MKNIIFTAAALICLTAPAFAQATPELDDENCKLLVEHQPSPDVAYQPGVDINGKPVVEADINPSPIQPPDTMEFDLNVDMATYGGIPPHDAAEGLANIGRITVSPEGRLTFNGQPLEGDAVAALRELCAKRPVNGAISTEKQPKVDLLKQ